MNDDFSETLNVYRSIGERWAYKTIEKAMADYLLCSIEELQEEIYFLTDEQKTHLLEYILERLKAGLRGVNND